MCLPRTPLTSLLQIGHSSLFPITNSGASRLHSVHKLFQICLFCAVCAQILMSNSGSPSSMCLACDTRFRRRPVFPCVRLFTNPNNARLASLFGAIRATWPSQRQYLRPISTFQSDTPSLPALASFVMRSSRICDHVMPRTARILPYQKLLMSLPAASGRGQFSHPYRRVVPTQTRNNRLLMYLANFRDCHKGLRRPWIFVASFTRRCTSSYMPRLWVSATRLPK